MRSPCWFGQRLASGFGDTAGYAQRVVSALMGVVEFEQRSRQPYAEGYERIDAVVQFAVDPNHDANVNVIDLDLAPRDAEGRVRFEADVIVLRPTEAKRSSGRLLGWVTNRGRNALLPFSVPPAGFLPTLGSDIEAGNGFLLRRGWTIALLGWQFDVQRGPGLIGLEAPRATGATTAITVQFQPNLARTRERLAHWPWHPDPRHMDAQHWAYPVADLHQTDAHLSVADYLGGPAQLLARDSWRFVDETHIEYPSGFEPGRVYSVSYTTAVCPVAGTGLVAVRDTMAYLRRHEPGINYVYGAGVSQTGRFLREFLWGGFNLDEAGQTVFDGLQVQVAGARRGDFNVRGAQPSAQYLAHSPTADPPYTYQALLETQRQRGGVPAVVHIDSASEYWRSDAYLVHGEEEPPPEVRCYLMAGTQHFPGLATLSNRPYPMPEVEAANHLNTVNHAPLLRSSLLRLDQWVSEGVEPPPSLVPRWRNGTAADRAEVLAAMAVSELGVNVPALDRLIGTCPVVAALGPDLNEVAGIRLPEVTEPLGAQAGWNVRGPSIGGLGQPLDMAGSMFPYPHPLPALDAYLVELENAADELIAQGWLLLEDRAATLAAAKRLHAKLAERAS